MKDYIILPKILGHPVDHQEGSLENIPAAQADSHQVAANKFTKPEETKMIHASGPGTGSLETPILGRNKNGIKIFIREL